MEENNNKINENDYPNRISIREDSRTKKNSFLPLGNKWIKKGLIILPILILLVIGIFFLANQSQETNKLDVENVYSGNPEDVLTTGIVEGKKIEEGNSLKIIPSVNADEPLNVSDLYGEITAYPAVATIIYSNNEGFLPVTQYLTFKNYRNINVNNVGIAGRFNGDLRRVKLFELVNV